MFKQTQPFQSAYFNYFDTTGDNLNTSNYTYWYKTNLFSWEILTICNNLNFSNHNFLTNPTFSVGRFQLFSHKWRHFELFKASCWYKTNHSRQKNSTIFNNLNSSYHTRWYKINLFSSDNSTIFNNLNSLNDTCSNKHNLFSRPIS